MIKENTLLHKVYRSLLVYLPFIQLNCIILFIYSIYVSNYIIIFLNDEWTISYCKNDLKNNELFQIRHYYIIHFIVHDKVHQYGIVLIIIFTWNIFWLFVSFHRTCYSNPGYIPSPLHFEIKLLSSITQKSQSESSHFKDSEFINTFHYIADNGPLTQKEAIQFKNAMNKCLARDITIMDKAINCKLLNENSHFIDNETIPLNMSIIDDFKISNPFNAYKTVDIHNLTLCSNCTRWKPERTHHCRHCNKCVLKMDHHCPWLGNCIGFQNYKFFLLSILYGLITSSIVLLTFWEIVIEVIVCYKVTLIKSILCVFAYLCNLLLFAFVSFLFYSNWRNVIYNITTIERSDQMRFSYHSKKNINQKNEIQLKYNKGIYSNIVSIFGRNPLLWLFPLYPNLEGEGIIF